MFVGFPTALVSMFPFSRSARAGSAFVAPIFESAGESRCRFTDENREAPLKAVEPSGVLTRTPSDLYQPISIGS
ncbi:hypothetical protein [Bradyrhizobium brasilense]|uniref:hypothetical protein n=1 Tax=Bradyrhizobium brasilense TaxID=1419277 RepID=UPI001E39DFEE|nr:hypothetical protein [Bradyrhizobium brasilense]MCC8969666.1 hypothetical protein [Bradyrhizobium brasilense]